MSGLPLQNPKFGDWYENTVAGVNNPTRIAMFVRIVRRTGKLNHGTWWEMTDGRGRFWLSNPQHLIPAEPASLTRTADAEVLEIMRTAVIELACHEAGISPRTNDGLRGHGWCEASQLSEAIGAVSELIKAAQPAITEEGMEQYELDRLRNALNHVGFAV